eukprot:scaffold301307_cov29-Tisochrysis_lutea.AAC.2
MGCPEGEASELAPRCVLLVALKEGLGQSLAHIHCALGPPKVAGTLQYQQLCAGYPAYEAVSVCHGHHPIQVTSDN